MNLPNRYICTVLEDMRRLLSVMKWYNFHKTKSTMAILVEDAQALANRMEAGLEDAADHGYNQLKFYKLKKEIRALQREKHSLKLEIDQLEDQLEE